MRDIEIGYLKTFNTDEEYSVSLERVDAPISTVKEIVAYRNKFLSVYDDEVVFANGQPGSYLRIVESDGRPGVAGLAMCRGLIALVKTYRYPLTAWEWAIPRGFAHGDDPVESIREELREELGAAPDAIDPLINVAPNSGLLSGIVCLFLAHYGAPVTDPHDKQEVAEVRWETLAQVRNEILSGELTDAFTVAAIGAAILKGKLRFE